MTTATVSRVPDAAYFAHEVGDASASLLKAFRRSPAHYHWEVRDQRHRKQTPSMLLGSAVHCLVLEPDQFSRRYVLEEIPGQSKAAKEWRAEQEAQGLTVLTGTILQTAQMMAQSAAALLPRGLICEHAIRWQLYGCVSCKAKLDALDVKNGVIWDLKTTTDGSPEGFRRSMWKYGYQYQMAFYRMAAEQLGIQCPKVRIIAVENVAPYLATTYTLAPDELDVFAGHLEDELYSLAGCVRSNSFPGYNDGEQDTVLSLYTRRDDDDGVEGLELEEADDA